MSKLFSEYRIHGLRLKNRLVMAPMCMFCAGEDGKVTDWHIHHYASRAVGGVGLIVIEATAISPEGRISSNDLGIWDDAHIEGLARLADAVHACGAKIGIQLGHAGRKCKADGMKIEAPSAIAFDDESEIPKEMSKEEIGQTVEEFRDAAVRAKKAGFDLVQIHGAHGYLLSEFLSPLCNTRVDEYGGTPAKRARFLGEVVEAVRTVWKDMPLEVRVSAEDYAEGGNTAKDLAEMLNVVKDKGIDSVNVSTGGVVSVMPKVFPNYQVEAAKTIGKMTSLPVVAGGLIESAREAERIIADGEAAQVYWGRELLRNPYFPLHAMKDLAPDQFSSAIPTQYKRGF